VAVARAAIDAQDFLSAREALAANAPLIERLARVNAPVDGTAGRGMIAVAAPGASFALPIGEVIDAGAEAGRLEKSLARSEKDAGGLRGRLGNPRFVENADPEVIEETREKLAALDEETVTMASGAVAASLRPKRNASS